MIIDRIRSQYSNIQPSNCCKEQGCELDLHDLNNYVVIKGEKLSQGDYKMCDCVIFDDRDTVTVTIVELKRSAFHSDAIIEKLCKGVEEALQILRKIHYRDSYHVQLILLTNHMPTFDMGALRRSNRFKIGKTKLTIKRCKCGQKLSVRKLDELRVLIPKSGGSLS